jgi:adenosylcobinamide-phosphate synthase
MTLFSILIALAAEQWLESDWRADLRRAFLRLADRIERHFNAGEYRHGVIGFVLAVGPPLVVALGVYWALYALHPLLALAWNAAVLYLTMGFRQFSQPFGEIGDALRTEDVTRARAALARWRGDGGVELTNEEIARLAIEQGLLDSHRYVFGTLFWFLLLPGPAGAVLYRAASLVAIRWQAEPESSAAPGREAFSRFAARVFHYLDWIPLRLTAVTFAVVGDFEDAVYCWRTQAREWQPFGEGIVLASGAGALGVRLGEPLRELDGGVLYRPEIGIGERADGQLMPSAVGLVWRSLAVWMILVLLMTLANWAG